MASGNLSGRQASVKAKENGKPKSWGQMGEKGTGDREVQCYARTAGLFQGEDERRETI